MIINKVYKVLLIQNFKNGKINAKHVQFYWKISKYKIC